MEAWQRFSNRYQRIIQKAEPYILGYPGNFKGFDFNPFGISIPEQNRFSCISMKNEKFFDHLHSLDRLSFGPKGMPMDKWVFYDCGEMPGGIFGFGLRPKDLPEVGLSEYKVRASDEDLVPISMYIAIPMAHSKNWFGHNLSSVSKMLGGEFAGLGTLTKAVALKAFCIETLFGATQWDSKSLNIHLQLANLNMESAWTPAHSFKNTLTYRSVYSDESIIQALSEIPRHAEDWDFLYPPDDEEFSKNIQHRIEKGENFEIVGRPVKKSGKDFFPIKLRK